MAVTLPTVRRRLWLCRYLPLLSAGLGEENDRLECRRLGGQRMTPEDQQPGTENGDRLHDHEVVEQLAAADAVLIALGRSSSNAGAVLATVAESAQRLCRCQGVQIYLLDGDEFEQAATAGLSPEIED